MEVLWLTLVLATIFAWCVLSGRLERAGLTAPIVFVTGGFVFSELLDLPVAESNPSW
jgi:sodium/hydrogen antiporter